MGSVCTHGYNSIPLMTGRVGNKEVVLLRDTVCDGVVVKRDLVESHQFTGDQHKLVLMNRSVIVVPVARITIDTPVFTDEVLALCIPDPICDLVVGNIPGVHPDIMGTACQPEEVLLSVERGKTGCAVQTRAQIQKEEKPTKPLKVVSPSSLQVTPRDFKEAQREDVDLARYYGFIELPNTGKTMKKKWFELSGGTLFRFYRRTEDDVLLKQAVVPKKLRSEVLKVGHEGILSGHLGIKKTTDRITAQFFWPGAFGDIKRFCQSCDNCQMTVS